MKQTPSSSQCTHSRTLRTFTFALSIIILLVFAGCSGNVGCSSHKQEYRVETMEALKQELADYPNTKYFDLSRYQPDSDWCYQINYTTQRGGPDPNRDYVIGNYNFEEGELANELKGSGLDTVLSTLVVSSLDLGRADIVKDGRSFSPNTSYRGIPVHLIENKTTVVLDMERYVSNETSLGFYDYPEGTIHYSFVYIFLHDNYEYNILAQFAVTHEEQERGEEQLIKDQALREVELLADSIIDQHE